jgi:hypothetical protein
MSMKSRTKEHNISDWLVLHELDAATCRRILEAAVSQLAVPPGTDSRSAESFATDPETAWLTTVDAIRAFFPEQRSIINETFEKTVKTLVALRNGSRRAVTVDNGPNTYPRILYTLRGEPSDLLVLAHEFAHALQIRVSKGKFVSPVMREVCAFVGELALLSHASSGDAPRYRRLSQAWHADNKRYFGTNKDRLTLALLDPETAYQYSWNYPVARYLAIQIAQRFSRGRMWALFEGDVSVPSVLRELDFERGLP